MQGERGGDGVEGDIVGIFESGSGSGTGTSMCIGVSGKERRTGKVIPIDCEAFRVLRGIFGVFMTGSGSWNKGTLPGWYLSIFLDFSSEDVCTLLLLGL